MQPKPVQKVQNEAVGFDVINIKELPIEKRIEYSQAIMGFKAIYDENDRTQFKLTHNV